MLSSLVTAFESFIVVNASLAVFLGCILEQIVVPIPASLIVLAATYLVLNGTSFSFAALGMLIIKIVIPASLGITIGSFVYYGLAYKLGMPFIERSTKYLGVSPEDIQEVGKKVEKSKYDDFFIFLARCFPVIPSIAINLFCGLIRYDLKKYIITTFFGSAVQILGWGMLAWFSGNIYKLLEDQVSYLGNIVTIIVLGVVIYYIISKRRENKRKNQ